MKHFFSGMLIALALVASLVVGVVAVAENAPEAPEPPAAEAQQPAEDAATDDAALKEAIEAYRAAKQSERQEALEAELKGFVESGKLTQEQADLILNYVKEQQAKRDGTCPSCGYQFRNNGKGGRMNGGKSGNRGMSNGRQGFGQQPTFGQQQMPGQANGMSFQPDALTLPTMNVNDGI